MTETKKLTHVLQADWLRYAGFSVIATSLVACGASATPQLADARRAYDEAEESPARTRAPGALAEARVALDRAEEAHDDKPGSNEEIRLSKRAGRMARAAKVSGDERAELDYPRTTHGVQRVTVVDDRRPVRDDRLPEVRDDHTHVVVRDDHTRQPSRKEADAALQSLAKVASVKEDERGLVITLSGALLFPSGKDEISPIARSSVDQVAHALAQQPDDTTFDIEGYTDSAGSDRENARLSAQRAQAVADRLAQTGIDGSRMSVAGRGEAAPIADNDTAEGRASNRRVEIVVDRRARK